MRQRGLDPSFLCPIMNIMSSTLGNFKKVMNDASGAAPNYSRITLNNLEGGSIYLGISNHINYNANIFVLAVYGPGFNIRLTSVCGTNNVVSTSTTSITIDNGGLWRLSLFKIGSTD